MPPSEFGDLARSQMTLQEQMGLPKWQDGSLAAMIRSRQNDGPLAAQVGGDHYKQMAIQPAEFIHKNGLGYLQGNIIKYVCRHASKGGEQDIRKAIHYCRLILKLEYGADD